MILQLIREQHHDWYITFSFLLIKCFEHNPRTVLVHIFQLGPFFTSAMAANFADTSIFISRANITAIACTRQSKCHWICDMIFTKKRAGVVVKSSNPASTMIAFTQIPLKLKLAVNNHEPRLQWQHPLNSHVTVKNATSETACISTIRRKIKINLSFPTYACKASFQIPPQIQAHQWYYLQIHHHPANQ